MKVGFLNEILKIISIVNKTWKKFEQFIKFGIVGFSNTLINLAVYYCCLSFGINYIVSYSIGFLVSVCNAFFWNSKYVFKNRRETNLLKAFLKAFASYGFSFLISIVLTSIMVEVFNVSPYIAPLFKMVITIPLNFLLNKIWAFKDKQVKDEVS